MSAPPGSGAEDAAGTVSSARQAELLRKYQQLLRWRRARDGEAATTMTTASAGEPATGADEPAVGPGSLASAPPPAVDAPEAATRAGLRALAREFPGCLRELDLLGQAELRRRVDVLRAMAHRAPAAPPDWLRFISAYHEMMKAELTVRAAAPRAAARRPAAAAARAGEAASPPLPGSPFAPGEVDAEFLRAIEPPPGGRLSALVLARLARTFATPAPRIAEMLFPSRRGAPPPCP